MEANGKAKAAKAREETQFEERVFCTLAVAVSGENAQQDRR